MADEKPSIFDDVEERPKDQASPEVEALKKELEKKDQDNALLQERLVQQNRARAEARRAEKAAKAEAAKPKEEPKEEPVEEPEVVEPEPEDKVEAPIAKSEDLEQVVESKLYEKSVVKAIKEKARYRDEAEVLKLYVDKLKAGGLSTGDAEEDVEAALALLNRNKGKSDAMPNPSSVGGGYVPEGKNRISKSALEMGKQFGHTREDFEKYGDGEIVIK